MRPLTPGRTIWLVQRYSAGTGFINPYGDMNNQIGHEEAQELMSSLVSPEYMGAAEYEWGAYPECLSKMFEHHLKLEEYYGFGPPIYIISQDIELAKAGIKKIYDETEVSFVGHDGKVYYDEISKGDYGSFRNVIDEEGRDIKTIGWLSLKGYYAWFTVKDIAETFMKLLTEDELNKMINTKQEEKTIKRIGVSID